MPSFTIDDMPASLIDLIQTEAKVRQRTPAATVVAVLEAAFRPTRATRGDAPLPSEPFLTEEIVAPYSLPRPVGTPCRAVRVAPPLPSAHDIPDEE